MSAFGCSQAVVFWGAINHPPTKAGSPVVHRNWDESQETCAILKPGDLCAHGAWWIWGGRTQTLLDSLQIKETSVVLVVFASRCLCTIGLEERIHEAMDRFLPQVFFCKKNILQQVSKIF
jgi:hypothetical protein